MGADADRAIQIVREMNRVNRDVVAEIRKHREMVRAYERRLQGFGASSEMLMGVAYAVTGEPVVGQRHIINALQSDPEVSTEFAASWPESNAVLEAARRQIAERSPPQGADVNFELAFKNLLELLRKLATPGKFGNV